MGYYWCNECSTEITEDEVDELEMAENDIGFFCPDCSSDNVDYHDYDGDD